MLGTLSGTEGQISSLNNLCSFRLMSDESEERTVSTYVDLLCRSGGKSIVEVDFHVLNI